MERHFDEELAVLRNDITKIGRLIEEAIFKSIDALKDLSPDKANKVIIEDRVIDQLELKIDEECLDFLALRQPMASDLRFITMSMKIATDLERMGDLAVDIAQRTLELSKYPHLKPLIDIPKLADLVQGMVRDSINSFINGDTDLAKSIILRDKQADALRDLVQGELLDYIAKDKSTRTRALSLILIARHLERISDHSTNIAEDIIFMVQAKVVKHHQEELGNGK